MIKVEISISKIVKNKKNLPEIPPILEKLKEHHHKILEFLIKLERI